jgi:hypothetical protein
MCRRARDFSDLEPLHMADSDHRILTIERTKVSARAGLQRSGMPLQIADSDDRILTVERTKVSARAGFQRPGVPLQIADADD